MFRAMLGPEVAEVSGDSPQSALIEKTLGKLQFSIAVMNGALSTRVGKGRHPISGATYSAAAVGTLGDR